MCDRVFVCVAKGQASEGDGLDRPLGAKELRGRVHILVRVLGTVVDLRLRATYKRALRKSLSKHNNNNYYYY